MHCADCGYLLDSSTDRRGGRCPECGRPFDPEDRRTWERRRRPPRKFMGFVASVAVLATAVLGIGIALQSDFAHDYDSAFAAIAGIGLSVGLVGVVMAVRNRDWWGRISILGASVLSTWAGIAMGVDHGFRVWQSAPNPPDEAFADGAKAMFAVLAGWLPSGVVVGIVFAVLLPFLSGMRRLPSRTNMGTKADSRTAPPTEPNAS